MGIFKLRTQRKLAPARCLTLAITLIPIIFFISQHRVQPNPTPSSHPLLAKYTHPHIRNATDDSTLQHTRQAIHLHNASDPKKSQPCLPYIFYDKPVKTGSTAVTAALKKYLDTVSEAPIPCSNMPHCTTVSEQVCIGETPPGHLIQHIQLNSSVTACLREKGYYHVTSIRDPKERIVSAWRFSLTKKTNHYGIPYNATFAQFLELFPVCSLYSYYDLLPARCTKEEAEERLKEIVSRFDEVIDLSDVAIGDVNRRIQPFLRDVNVAPSGRAQAGEIQVPDHVVQLEYLLYNALKEKRVSLAQHPKRTLCER